MRKLKHRQVERNAKEGRDALAWVQDNAPAIVARANSDSFDGFGPGSSNGRLSGTSDPTAVTALAQRDRRVELAAGQFAEALAEARLAARRAARIGEAILYTTTRTPRETEAAAPDHCANCGTFVANTRADRLRSGRCPACYQYRLEHHNNERPRHLWVGHEEPANL